MNKSLVFLAALTIHSFQFKSISQAEEGPLSLHLYPQNQQIKMGETVKWYLTAAGSEPMEYQWKLDGNNLSGPQSNTLEISSVKSSDKGLYTCAVTNKFGTVETGPVKLFLAPVGSIATFQKINIHKAPENAAAQNIVKPEN